MEPLKDLCLYCMSFKGPHDICPHCGAGPESPFIMGGLPLGHLLNKRYVVGRLLATDDFFVQYLGFDAQTRKKVIITEFFPRHLVERDAEGIRLQMVGNDTIQRVRKGIDRFLEEVEALSTLDRYPGIIPVVEGFRENNTAYSVRWFIEGEKLQQYLSRKRGRIPADEALRIISPLMEVLSVFHGKGFFHGNISPHHVFLASDGSVKLLDFNGARFVVGENRYELLEEGYAAPELYSDRLEKGPASDVYGLAALLYRMIAGSPPPPAMERVLNDTLMPLEGTTDPLIAKIDRALRKALAVKTEERFATIEKFARALPSLRETTGLKAVPRNETSGVKPASPSSVTIPPRLVQGLAIGAVAIAVVIIVTATVRIDLSKLFGAAGTTPPTGEKTAPGVVEEKASQTVLRLCGSNTIGAKLAPRLAALLLKKEGAPETTEVIERPNEQTIRATLGEGPVAIAVEAHGTGTGFEKLLKNECEIAMASRPIKETEAERFAEAGFGDMTSHLSEHILAMDGLAIIVHKANPLEEMTVETAAALFSGKLSRWEEISDAFSGAIVRHARDDKSGTYDTFVHLVLRKEKLEESTIRWESNADLSDAVAKDIFAIGFTGLPYIRESKALAIAEGNGVPLYPTVFSVSTEDYPLSRRLFLYTAQSPSNPWVAKFLAVSLSAEGQHVVEETGFLSLLPRLESPRIPADAPAAYREETANFKRLSVNLRFRFNSVELDNKAKRDAERILDMLSLPEYRHRMVRLIGFSDAVGTPESCVAISRLRTAAVADYFRRRGVNVAVSAYGSAVPVANNATEEGRNRNRRVEIWVENQ